MRKSGLDVKAVCLHVEPDLSSFVGMNVMGKYWGVNDDCA